MPENIPAKPLPDDVIDRVAKEVSAQVTLHIAMMYPDAAKAVAWQSAARSIQGVVRNTMASLSRSAEIGDIDQALMEMRKRRLIEAANWRKAGVGHHE